VTAPDPRIEVAKQAILREFGEMTAMRSCLRLGERLLFAERAGESAVAALDAHDRERSEKSRETMGAWEAEHPSEWEAVDERD
jgi:hypothetical protein